MLITNVDRVLEMVRTRKELPVKAIAAALHADPKSIEKLGKLLEEEKKLTITYKMFDPWLVAGFQEKGKGQKKPLFVWKKKQAAPVALSAPPARQQAPAAEAPPAPPLHQPLFAGKKKAAPLQAAPSPKGMQEDVKSRPAQPAAELQAPPPPPAHKPLFSWKKQQQPRPASPSSVLPAPPQPKHLFSWKKQPDGQQQVTQQAKHFSFPFLGKRHDTPAAAKQEPKSNNPFIRLTPQAEPVSTNKDRELEQQLNQIITRAAESLKAKSYKDVYTAYNAGSALYKELQGADSRMKYFKRLSAIHDALLQELKH